VATAGGEAIRPSFGFVLRAVAAEQADRVPAGRTARRKQAGGQPACRRHGRARLPRAPRRCRRPAAHAPAPHPCGERIRRRAREESRAIEDELRNSFGDEPVAHLRALLTDFVERHGGGEELTAQRIKGASQLM
jgi:hypothetical protein